MLKPWSRRWVAGGVALVAVLFAVDWLTEATVPVSLIAVCPLLAAART